MHTTKKHNEFILLRAQGLSYIKIAQKLKVSKQTLLRWAKEYSIEIKNLKTLEVENLLTAYKLTRNHQLKRLGKYLEKLDTEINTRDLSNIPTEKLLKLYLSLIDTTLKFDTNLSFKTPEDVRSLKPSLEEWYT